MRKKFKIILLSLVLLIVGGLKIYAATGTAELTINTSKTEAKVDETVTFNVVVNCETGIEGFDATLEYDDSKLELQNVNVDNKFSNMSGKDEATGEYKLTVILNTVETVTQAKVATIDFKVLESAKVGDKITVKISDIEVGDAEEEWFQLEDENATIEVVELINEGNKPGDEEPGNGENKPSTEGEKTDEDESKPGTEDEKANTNNPEKDKTQADKEIDKTGIENYVLVVIGIMAICSYIFYKKYQKYKNM